MLVTAGRGARSVKVVERGTVAVGSGANSTGTEGGKKIKNGGRVVGDHHVPICV